MEQKRPDTREIAVVDVRDRWSSYPSKGLTPERLARIFLEADAGDVMRQAELFEEMEEKDAHLASQLQIRKLAVQGLDWDVFPRGDEERDKDIAAFCRGVLAGLNLDEHVVDLLDALGKGYSVMEIVWDLSAGEAMIRELRWVHPKKVTFLDSVTPRILTEEESIYGIQLPPWKFVYHRYKARSGYDTRAGILRVCGWMYLFKNYGIKDWVTFAEVYGMPLRIGKYEPGASKDDKDALLTALRALGTDAAGIISKNTEIEFLDTTRTGTVRGRVTQANIYESLVDFCDAQMSKAILGQVLTSEAGGSKGEGSLALGKVHADVRQDLVRADCKALNRTITRQILRPLVGFNFGWDAPVPRFSFLYQPPEDLLQLARVYKTIVGRLGLQISQEHIQERFKIPMRKDGETPLAAKTSQPDSKEAKLARLIDLAGGEDGEVDSCRLQVLHLVAKHNSFEEIMAGIRRLHPHTDGPSRELVEQQMLAADLWAYLQG
jgi:phage gp29-like protein